MLTAAGTIVSKGFSKPGLHSLTYKDDFCSFASNVREELLCYPKWREMRQTEAGGAEVFVPHRQNGITTGHLGELELERLPNCLKFRDFLTQNLEVLCSLAGVDPTDAQDVEINAMAYGAGAWLSPHTDFFEYRSAENRLAAWMLYLTAPEDGEWSADKGGAVRIWKPGIGEERIRPRFNRFVMFEVHNDSFHEIEKITWDPEWTNCRLALSGWIRGRATPKTARNTAMYLQSSSVEEKRKEIEAFLQGSIALHRLLTKQMIYSGRDASTTVDRVTEFEQNYLAHKRAPTGTSFLRRVSGPTGLIIVVNEAGKTVHFGTVEEYEEKWTRESRAIEIGD